MYAGEDLDCCFIESFGQTTGLPAMSGAYLEGRHFAELQLQSDLRFADLVEPGSLSRIGADGRLLTGSCGTLSAVVCRAQKSPCETGWNPLPLAPRSGEDRIRHRMNVQARRSVCLNTDH